MKILLSNSIWFLLSGIFLTFIAVDSAQAQTEKEILKIRTKVAAINKDASKYTKTTKNVEDISLEGTEATYYKSAGNLKKITAKMYGETFNATAEFYYADGELIFAYLKQNQYETQIGTGKTPKVVRVEEQRFYYSNGTLRRLLVGKKELKSGTDYDRLKKEIINISDKLKDS